MIHRFFALAREKNATQPGARPTALQPEATTKKQTTWPAPVYAISDQALAGTSKTVAKCGGRHTIDFLEHPGEMIRILITTTLSNLTNTLRGPHDERSGVRHLELDQILVG